MNRTGWESVAALALVATPAAGGICFGRFVLKMIENLLNDLGVLNAGNDFDLSAAVFTDLDVT